MHSQRRTLLAAIALSPVAHVSSTFATGVEQVDLVVPAPPGSQPDQIARWLTEPMARQSGARVAVHNRPGAAGAIAADAVLAPHPRGTAPLLLGGLDHVAYSHIGNHRRALDPFRDFVPVGTINRDAWLVVAAPGVASDLRGLVEASRARGEIAYATTGNGSTAHLVTARLVTGLGIDATHVPYKDSFLPDLMAGRVQFAVAPLPAVIGQVRDRKVVPLAVLSATRQAIVPDVPTAAEAGWPTQVFEGGLFLFAPAALSGQAGTINAWLVAALNDPGVIERYRQAGIVPTPLDLAQTHASVTERMARVDAMRIVVFGQAR